jgi:Flp pilus assembly protein TadG
MCKQLQNQRGQTLIALAITLLAFFALAAVGIDLGHLAHTVNELQIAADAGAVAAASTLLTGVNDGTGGGSPSAITQATADALTAAGQNAVDGHFAPDQITVVVTTGTYDAAAGTYAANLLPANAAQVSITKTVHNLFGAAIFAAIDSDYTRVGTAVFEFPSSATPDSRTSIANGHTPQSGTLPIAVGDAFFNAYQVGGDNCTALQAVTLVLAPSAGNDTGLADTGWTSFSNGPPGAPNGGLDPYLPAGCGCGNCGTTVPPTLTIGNQVNFVAGPSNQLVTSINGCLTNGITTFMIPVVPSTGVPFAAGSSTVSGFATFELTNVDVALGTLTGNLSCNAQEPGLPGGGDFGTGFARIIQNPS